MLRCKRRKSPGRHPTSRIPEVLPVLGGGNDALSEEEGDMMDDIWRMSVENEFYPDEVAGYLNPHPLRRVFLFVRDGVAVGFATCFVQMKEEGCSVLLDHFLIDSKVRSLRLGGAFFNMLIEHFQNLVASHCCSLVWLQSVPSAVGFWQRMGFSIIGDEWVGEYTRMAFCVLK